MLVFATLLAGCSQVERVNLLADRWNKGEHKKCTFLTPSEFICDGEQPLLSWEAGDLKASLANSTVIERGEYDASFPARPTDYALWDCRKTGDSAAAISCTFISKPAAQDLDAIRVMEEDGKKIMAMKAEVADAQAESDAMKKKCLADAIKFRTGDYEIDAMVDGACKIAAINIVTKMVLPSKLQSAGRRLCHSAPPFEEI